MNVRPRFRKTERSISAAPEVMEEGEAAVCEATPGGLWWEVTATRPLPAESLGPRLASSLTSGPAWEAQCVSGHRVSRPALIFDDVESLSSEAEEKRPLHAGNKMRWAVWRAPGCPGPERSTTL